MKLTRKPFQFNFRVNQTRLVLSGLLAATLTLSALSSPASWGATRQKGVRKPAQSSASAESPTPLTMKDIEWKSAQSNQIVLKWTTPDGKSAERTLTTELYEIEYLGKIAPPMSESDSIPPYFLFSGRPCLGCLQDRAIYAIKPDGKISTFLYPGQILDPKSGAIVTEITSFYGQCLKNKSSSVYLAFLREKVDRRPGLQPAVFIAEAGPDHLIERVLERNLPRIKDTQLAVKQKKCWAISGAKRKVLKRPLDVDLKRNAKDLDQDPDDEEEDLAPQKAPPEKTSPSP